MAEDIWFKMSDVVCRLHHPLRDTGKYNRYPEMMMAAANAVAKLVGDTSLRHPKGIELTRGEFIESHAANYRGIDMTYVVHGERHKDTLHRVAEVYFHLKPRHGPADKLKASLDRVIIEACEKILKR